jgi:hypothetical protein
LAELALEREEPLLAREALLRLRVEAADFELDPFDRDPLAFVFDPDPLEALLLRCPLRALDLLLAIRPFSHRGDSLPRFVSPQMPPVTQCAVICRGSPIRARTG